MMIYLPPNPEYYRDVPKLLANLHKPVLTGEERQHLQARAKSAQNRPVHFRVLNWVGKRLVLWGIALTDHYSPNRLSPANM
jgi:hypothetical protein